MPTIPSADTTEGFCEGWDEYVSFENKEAQRAEKITDDIHDKSAEWAANAYFAPLENAIKAFESSPCRQTALELQVKAHEAHRADLIDGDTLRLITIATRIFLGDGR